ncbi:hypothetical protein R3P38DRAFT_3172043 [Favolaschia claudopus]|uniref:Uncharacterized protein n=1 Tax=Favolaschia claudopus TaxID=2862362 RepID=A0AAW0DL34_9AGAR
MNTGAKPMKMGERKRCYCHTVTSRSPKSGQVLLLLSSLTLRLTSRGAQRASRSLPPTSRWCFVATGPRLLNCPILPPPTPLVHLNLSVDTNSSPRRIAQKKVSRRIQVKSCINALTCSRHGRHLSWRAQGQRLGRHLQASQWEDAKKNVKKQLEERYPGQEQVVLYSFAVLSLTWLDVLGCRRYAFLVSDIERLTSIFFSRLPFFYRDPLHNALFIDIVFPPLTRRVVDYRPHAPSYPKHSPATCDRYVRVCLSINKNAPASPLSTVARIIFLAPRTAAVVGVYPPANTMERSTPQWQSSGLLVILGRDPQLLRLPSSIFPREAHAHPQLGQESRPTPSLWTPPNRTLPAFSTTVSIRQLVITDVSGNEQHLPRPPDLSLLTPAFGEAANSPIRIGEVENDEGTARFSLSFLSLSALSSASLVSPRFEDSPPLDPYSDCINKELILVLDGG